MPEVLDPRKFRINAGKLRAHMAEEQLTIPAIAAEMGMSYWRFSDILSGREAPGEIARLRIAIGCRARGWNDVITQAE